MIQIVFERFACQDVAFSEAQSARCHCRIADRVHGNNRVVLFPRPPHETAPFIRDQLHFTLVVEIAPEIIHPVRYDVVDDGVDLHRGNGTRARLQSFEHLSAST